MRRSECDPGDPFEVAFADLYSRSPRAAYDWMDRVKEADRVTRERMARDHAARDRLQRSPTENHDPGDENRSER